MCIVVDMDALSRVLDEENEEHSAFRPVFEWILDGPGMFVYGGSTYESQLKRANKLRRLMKLHADSGHVCAVPDKEVDDVEAQLRKKEPNPAFNDAHLVAIVIVSKCRLICTCDHKSHAFLLNRALYPKKLPVPKIYGGSPQCRKLLSNQNLRPCKQSSKCK